MGRRNKNVPKGGSNASENKSSTLIKKLPIQKRNELNHLIDKLLKVTSNVPSIYNATKCWELHLEIDKLLTKIKTLEMDISSKLPERDIISIQKLTKWMEENNSKLNGVEISRFPFKDLEYGLKATKDLTENELIITVPRKVMLSSENMSSDLGELLRSDPLLQHMPNVTLAILLLIERFKKDSFWTPYINMLPSTYNTVMYFSLEELKELKGSPTFESALKQCRNIARQYAYFYNLFQNKTDSVIANLSEVFTYEHYRWSVSTVMTRQNFVPSKTEKGTKVHALIPFWDMANHTNAKITTDYSDEREESLCFAYKDFSAGEQVMISYGARPNHDLLVHNGFVFPENVHDSLMFHLGVSKSDPLYIKRSRLLEILGQPSSGQQYLFAGPRPVREPLLAFLRVFCMSEENLDKWLAQEEVSNLGNEDCEVDTCVDKKVWEFLKMRITLLLASYPTKLEEDEKMFSCEENLTPCQWLALLQRMVEKILLIHAFDFITKNIKSKV